jgi:hypothetical protein
MKYKLINRKTGEEHICSRETVNGFDFYIGGVIKDIHELNVWDTTDSKFHPFLKFIGTSRYAIESFEKGHFLKVIATNDHSKEIPQVVDEVEELAKILYRDGMFDLYDIAQSQRESFIEGYNHSQYSHPHSDNDVVEFLDWLSMDGYPCIENQNKGLWVFHPQDCKNYTTKELLQLWKEERIKTIYYE